MRTTMWIYAALILLLSVTWRVDAAVENLTFNLGSEVKLACSNKTWNEMLFVIWNIDLKWKKCKIAFNEGRSDDYCNDGKSLQNTSSARSYLHIPNFSEDDVGVYKCESVYKGGNDNYAVHVAIRVPPSISAWLEQKDNKMVAVCKAENGKPAANISWNHIGNISDWKSVADGFFTVESRLEILEGMDIENLNCTIRHPSWKGERVLGLKFKKGFPWLPVLIVVIIVCLAGFLFFAQRKLISLSRCRRPETTPKSKLPTPEDTEEVEPYASYVQRVNSIYNSSADLFT